jgi:hypothetical protein
MKKVLYKTRTSFPYLIVKFSLNLAQSLEVGLPGNVVSRESVLVVWRDVFRQLIVGRGLDDLAPDPLLFSLLLLSHEPFERIFDLVKVRKMNRRLLTNVIADRVNLKQ